jgi:hypothetical protein
MKNFLIKYFILIPTLIILIVPTSKAQLPINLISSNTQVNTYVGLDFFTFALPISIVATTAYELNSFRFGASPTYPDSDNSYINDFDVDQFTFFLEYDRLIKTGTTSFFEVGSAILLGSSFQSGNQLIETPAIGFNLGFRSIIANKMLFRLSVSPVINTTKTTLTVGIGLSYRIGK